MVLWLQWQWGPGTSGLVEAGEAGTGVRRGRGSCRPRLGKGGSEGAERDRVADPGDFGFFSTLRHWERLGQGRWLPVAHACLETWHTPECLELWCRPDLPLRSSSVGTFNVCDLRQVTPLSSASSAVKHEPLP